MKKKSNHLGLFAKYWQPGKVKTRLAATLGNEAASGVYLAFLKYLLAKFRHLDIDKTVFFSPTKNRSDFQSLLQDDWSLHPQSDGDLGSRLTQYFWETIAQYQRSVVIGSDCLSITPNLIDEAFAALHTNDMVIGPSPDGGYYLLGLTDVYPELFENIEWSSSRVFEQTVNIANDAGLSIQMLAPHTDIDEPSDLEQLIGKLESHSGGTLDDLLLNSLAVVVKQ